MKRNKYISCVRRYTAANMTENDKKELAKWVSDGNSPLGNPWHMCREDSRPFDFITALHIVNEMAKEMECGIEGILAEITDDPVMAPPF